MRVLLLVCLLLLNHCGPGYRASVPIAGFRCYPEEWGQSLNADGGQSLICVCRDAAAVNGCVWVPK